MPTNKRYRALSLYGQPREPLLRRGRSAVASLHEFYTKWLDGRIDDPDGGWKGRGLWATVSTRAPFQMEGGKGTPGKVSTVPVAARSAGEVTRESLLSATTAAKWQAREGSRPVD